MKKAAYTCIGCQKTFTPTPGQLACIAQKWGTSKWCAPCREKRGSEKYQGIRGAMYPDFQKRHRHSRVPYAPFTVGGMR